MSSHNCTYCGWRYPNHRPTCDRPPYEPRYAYAYSNRGRAYIELGHYQKAIADYDKAIQIRKFSHPPDYVRRGEAYRGLGNIAEADRAKACSLDSKYC